MLMSYRPQRPIRLAVDQEHRGMEQPGSLAVMTSRAQGVPRDPELEARVGTSFARQRFMTQLGARLVAVAPGAVEIELPIKEELANRKRMSSACTCEP
jgi:hypothetical protein